MHDVIIINSVTTWPLQVQLATNMDIMLNYVYRMPTMRQISVPYDYTAMHVVLIMHVTPLSKTVQVIIS